MLDSLDDGRLMFGLPFGDPKQEEPVDQCFTDRALSSDLVTRSIDEHLRNHQEIRCALSRLQFAEAHSTVNMQSLTFCG